MVARLDGHERLQEGPGCTPSFRTWTNPQASGRTLLHFTSPFGANIHLLILFAHDRAFTDLSMYFYLSSTYCIILAFRTVALHALVLPM
ncbi:hypothetical protein K523DRAFT_76591 [Schizophyllum commune Tattone D]|nr:hypothetical protein K523DRAFT_76591 [Schizophyllum commune Tattone D]